MRYAVIAKIVGDDTRESDGGGVVVGLAYVYLQGQKLLSISIRLGLNLSSSRHGLRGIFQGSHVTVVAAGEPHVYRAFGTVSQGCFRKHRHAKKKKATHTHTHTTCGSASF